MKTLASIALSFITLSSFAQDSLATKFDSLLNPLVDAHIHTWDDQIACLPNPLAYFSNYTWHLDNNTTITGNTACHQFAAGTHSITVAGALTCLDSSGHTFTDTAHIELVVETSLQQNLNCSPNPSNGPFSIQYLLPEDAAMNLQVLDQYGNKVATLHNGPQLTGTHNCTFHPQAHGHSGAGSFVLVWTVLNRSYSYPMIAIP